MLTSEDLTPLLSLSPSPPLFSILVFSNRADDLQRKLTLAQEENERLEDRIAEHADGNNRQVRTPRHVCLLVL